MIVDQNYFELKHFLFHPIKMKDLKIKLEEIKNINNSQKFDEFIEKNPKADQT
jgi:hypothetical protein